MPKFLTPITITKVGCNGDTYVWEVHEDLIYETGIPTPIGSFITVPTGFITDLASVPRIPLAYLLAGGEAPASAVVHDYLYKFQVFNRETCDKIFLEAMKEEGVGFIKRYLMYYAVRVFGSKPYEKT